MSGGKKKTEKIEIQVSREAVFVEEARCPEGCDLIDRSVSIHGHPSIGLRYSFDDHEGMIYLDPAYGSFENRSDLPIPDGKIVALRCPKCGASLRDDSEECPTCAAPMFVLHLPGGGILEGCLRKGCFSHRLRIVDLDAQILRLYKAEIGSPGIDV